jgi:hypothetical protein
VARYLSDEWLAELDRAAAADDGLRRATAGHHLVVQHDVTLGPDGDVTFHVDIDDGTVSFRPGAAASPTVTFTQDHETASAVGKGELSAQGAFMTGRLRVAGDLPALVDHHDALVGVDDVFAEVRSRTTW